MRINPYSLAAFAVQLSFFLCVLRVPFDELRTGFVVQLLNFSALICG